MQCLFLENLEFFNRLENEIKCLEISNDDFPVFQKIQKLLQSEQFEYYFNTDHSQQLLRELDSIRLMCKILLHICNNLTN